MIDQAMDAWQQQPKTKHMRSGIPGFIFRAPACSGFTIPASEIMRFGEMTLAPFKLRIEAAETWHLDGRNVGEAFPEHSSIARAPSSRGLGASTREAGHAGRRPPSAEPSAACISYHCCTVADVRP